MSRDDQDAFISKWYSAVAAELRGSLRRAENLDKLAASLKQELRETPGIARLAVYPLLCAMICALYRERNQKLPETQAALCEDLCKMLLHRRERETPDMKLTHLPPDYRKLDYEQKKYLVAEIAMYMVQKRISSLEEAEADRLVESALQHFPDYATANAGEIRRALVERSGLLRPSGVNCIDFLHNTLKEYLAAGRFVADDAYRLLAKHLDDDSWQPVILFAAALPTPGFASKLMRELLRAVEPSTRRRRRVAGRPARAKEIAARNRSREFFLVRCRNAAFRLEPELVDRVDQLASGLFPPNTIADAEALATLGEAVLPHLVPKQRLNSRQRVTCIRALRLIGGEKAASLIKRFPAEQTKPVLAELLAAAADLNTRVRLTSDSLDLSSTSVRDLSPLAGATTLRSLNLAGTQVCDLSPLAGMKALRSLDLSGTQALDLSPLARLTSLEMLVLRFAGRSHPWYYPGRRPVRLGLWPFEAAVVMEIPPTLGIDADLDHLVCDRLVHLAWESRRCLNPRMSRRWLNPRMIEEVRRRYPPLQHLEEQTAASIAWLFIRTRRLGPFEDTLDSLPLFVRDAGYLERVPEPLRRVLEAQRPDSLLRAWEQGVFGGTKVGRPDGAASFLSPLMGLRNLKVLDLSGLELVKLSPLSTLTRLEALSLSGSCAFDWSPLRGLRALRWLEVSWTPIVDVSSLAGLKALRVLDLAGTEISDLSPLRRLTALRVLSLAHTRVSDFSPVLELPSLRQLLVSRGRQARELRRLTRGNQDLTIHALPPPVPFWE